MRAIAALLSALLWVAAPLQAQRGGSTPLAAGGATVTILHFNDVYEIRILPFGGKILKATVTGALLRRLLAVGWQNQGTGGYLHFSGLPSIIGPTARYTVAISDFLLTGAEVNLGFLTRDNPDVSDVAEFRDIRMAVIDELKSRSK